MPIISLEILRASTDAVGFHGLIHTAALARWPRVTFSPSETVSTAITYLANPLTGRCVYSHVPAKLRLRRRMVGCWLCPAVSSP